MPKGWYCTRAANHDGPCAGWQTDTVGRRVMHAINALLGK